MKTFERLTHSSELQLTPGYEIYLDNYLSLWEYDRIILERKLKDQFED
jgi:hypothetical protein